MLSEMSQCAHSPVTVMRRPKYQNVEAASEVYSQIYISNQPFWSLSEGKWHVKIRGSAFKRLLFE